MTWMRGICRLAVAVAIGLCALTNAAAAEIRKPPPGKFKIVKKTIGGDDDFKFTKGDWGHSFTLRNGESKEFKVYYKKTFRIEEVDLPADWSLKSVTCTCEFNQEGRAIYVHVRRGEYVTCTFTNFKGHDDTTKKTTDLFIRRRLDNLLTNGPDRARLLRRLQPAEQVESLKDGPIKLAAGGNDDQSVDDSAPDHVRAIRGEEPAAQQVTRSGNPLFDSIAGQVANAFAGTNELHFSASLSGLRADAARAAAQKAQAAGVGLDANPYTNTAYVPRPSFDIWVEGRISRYDDDAANLNRDGRFRVLYVGADYIVAPGVLVGVLGELDDTVEDLDNGVSGRIDGTGWTAGPYIGIVLGEGIFFDARAAWGTSDNDIEITDAAAGARSGSFDTDRWLTKASLTANRYYGAWRVTPQVGIAYGEEEYDSYVTTLGQIVDGDRASLGQATGEVEVGYRFVTTSGTFIEPTLAVEGIWSFDSDDVVVNGVGYGTNESRAKVEAGLMLTDPSGFGLRWSAAYDGIGADDYDAWQGSLWVNVPLN